MAGVGAGVCWILASPPSKENGGALHCSPHGLVAYGAGSSVVVMEVQSMQLIAVLPMPALKSAPLHPAPFVTAVQWTPEGIPRDLAQDFSTAHLQLAVGDRQGRIAIWDVASGNVCTWLELEAEKGRQGIQDLCWVYGQPWLLAAIHGPTGVSIWNPTTGNVVWRFDSGSELLGCVRSDPFDSRQICIVGLRGLLLSILIGGVSESEILMKQYTVPGQEEKGTTVTNEKSKDGAPASGSTSSGAPALASVPGTVVRCLYSTRRRGLLYVMMPREIVIFDLAFGMLLGSTPLPRGCGKFLDLLAVVDDDVLYCAHQDGKVSAWRRKEEKQVFSLCHMGTLMPSIGSPVPAPTVLAVVHCPLQLQVQTSNGDQPALLQLDPHPEPDAVPVPDQVLGKTEYLEAKGSHSFQATFLSVSDDGRLWQWVINKDDTEREVVYLNGNKNVMLSPDVRSTPRTFVDPNSSADGATQTVHTSSNGLHPEPVFKLELTGQLQLLSSAITTLAVPMPSLLSMNPGVQGSNAGAVSVPLVALACQGGTVELVDTAANAITASFSVHNNQTVRGIRWLGNTRLVSFSYTEVKGKGGGFVNRLVLTCVRSGQSKAFRVLQKPERSPMRALRASPSGRYLLILFKEAPAEVWAMTRTPQMLRSLALPFTVMEWALPPAPKTAAASAAAAWARKSTLQYKERPTIASAAAAANAPSSTVLSDAQETENAESFAFALVNGSLGVFELRGRRVRDFRPRWPAASFVSADVLITAMAYRTPHVVMGDRTGNIRWWDVITGLSSNFNTHRGGVRRIKFAPVRIGDTTRGRIAVLFNDHSFAVYDLDTHDPLANALVQPHLGGILVLELDWYPLRQDKNEPLLLCIAGADGSFRLLEVQNVTGGKSGQLAKPSQWQRYRPMPLCSAALLPPPHALSLRVLLQQGVQPSWFLSKNACTDEENVAKPLYQPMGSQGGDLRHYLLETENPVLGETVFAEVLLKALEPYRRAGRLLNEEKESQYAAICRQGVATRCAFAAAQFGEYSEAVFWLQLPRALALLSYGSAGPASFWRILERSNSSQVGSSPQESNGSGIFTSKVEVNKSLDSGMTFITPKVVIRSSPEGVLPTPPFKLPNGCMDMMPSEQAEVCSVARERIGWHEKFTGTEATQRRVHELIAVGDFEAAVTLLLATPPSNPLFYMDALRAVSLASAVSTGLHELAVKVVAANMVGTDDSLSGTHLLCAVGRYQEACSQLQDAGRWVDAATLAATHLQGSDHARVLERWAEHVLNNEHNLWRKMWSCLRERVVNNLIVVDGHFIGFRAMILFVAAGALVEALATLRSAKQPDTAAMFLMACHEAKVTARASRADIHEPEIEGANLLDLPGELFCHREEVQAVCEYYWQYQRHLAHSCTGTMAVVD